MGEMGKKNGAESTAPRRKFLTWLWYTLGLAAAMEVVWLVVSFLKPRTPKAAKGDFGALFAAGSVDDFPAGTVTAFPRGRFYLSRLEDGGFLAILRSCTHLGCTVPWVAENQRFACPCHSSAFDITGEVISSPAPRALDIYRVFIENGIVHVDTGRRIQRTGFQPHQVTYPSKVVS